MKSKDFKITIVNQDDYLRLYEFEYQKLPDGSKFCHHLLAHSFDEAYCLSLSEFPVDEYDLYDYDFRLFDKITLDGLCSSIDASVFYEQGITEVERSNSIINSVPSMSNKSLK